MSATTEQKVTANGHVVEVLTSAPAAGSGTYVSLCQNRENDSLYVMLHYHPDRKTALTEAANALRLAADLLGNWSGPEEPFEP